MRKYQIISGYMVYAHITPNRMIYIGMSKLQPCRRWRPSMYQGKSLYPYIEQYGWENIEHRVLIDGLSKEQAEQIEDWFIRKATADGFCINKQGSGGLCRDDRKAYDKRYHKEHKEEKQAYCKQWRSTIEGKIYYRVSNYNRNHTPIETPKEAKQKYLATGYIPAYIKTSDLI